MRVLLMLGGDAPPRELLLREAGRAQRMYAADSGVEALLAHGLYPDVLVGDMDSIRPGALEGIKGRSMEILTMPAEKDDTDGLAALKLAIGHGAKQIVILGGTGGRIDHLMANLMLLFHACQRGVDAVLRDGMHEVSALWGPSAYRGRGEAGELVSLIPWGRAHVAGTFGLKYPLKNAWLTEGFLPIGVPVGVSNEVDGGDFGVEVSEGGLLIFRVRSAGE